MTKALFVKLSFGLALALILLNIIGIFISLRNDAIYSEKLPYNFGIKYTEEQFYKELDGLEKSTMSDSVWVIKSTRLVTDGMAHYWEEENGIKKYNLTLPIYENYILYFLSFVHPRIERFEFVEWKKIIERGVGECSGHAIVQSEILNKNGITSNIAMLDGHVVVTSEVGNHKWITSDPDLGVAIPYSISEIEQDVSKITPYYKAEGYDDKTIEWLKGIYGKEGNVIYKDAIAYKGLAGYLGRATYVFIWIIPVFLCIPFILFRLKKKKAPSQRFMNGMLQSAA
jgi:prepilin-type processing-associated H-X9-DG protein